MKKIFKMFFYLLFIFLHSGHKTTEEDGLIVYFERWNFYVKLNYKNIPKWIESSWNNSFNSIVFLFNLFCYSRRLISEHIVTWYIERYIVDGTLHYKNHHFVCLCFPQISYFIQKTEVLLSLFSILFFE